MLEPVHVVLDVELVRRLKPIADAENQSVEELVVEKIRQIVREVESRRKMDH